MNSSVKIGIAPINWSNDDMPELGENITLDQCLSEMQTAGYDGTESVPCTHLRAHETSLHLVCRLLLQ
mgnify:CR=1 FL=1